MDKCKVENSPCVPCGSYGSSLCDECLYTKIIKERDSLRAELARERERYAGIEPDRLREICSAELDGRCVVLPCKPNINLYDDKGRDLIIFSLEIGPYDVLVRTVPLGGGVVNTYRKQDFEKTIFTTPKWMRAEAEAALKEGEAK